jgi:hypothetical protein
VAAFQLCVDCGVLVDGHLSKQHTKAKNAQAAARIHVDHFTGQFANACAIGEPR